MGLFFFLLFLFCNTWNINIFIDLYKLAIKGRLLEYNFTIHFTIPISVGIGYRKQQNIHIVQHNLADFLVCRHKDITERTRIIMSIRRITFIPNIIPEIETK